MRCVLSPFLVYFIVLLNLGHCREDIDCESPLSVVSSMQQTPVNTPMHFSLWPEISNFNVLAYLNNFLIQDTSIDTPVSSSNSSELSVNSRSSLDAIERALELSSSISDSDISQRAESPLSVISDQGETAINLVSLAELSARQQMYSDAFTQTSQEFGEELHVQRMRRACLESYVYLMSHFWGFTLNLLNVGEIVCPLAALYFLYFSPSGTEEQQNWNNRLSGIFITITLFCSTIKQSSKKIISLRNKFIKCCFGGINTERAVADSETSSTNSSN